MAPASSANNHSDSAQLDNVFLIGAGFSVDGEVQGQGTLIVSGTIRGNVRADTVKLNESGLVEGHIDCDQLEVAGRLNGSFNAGDVVVRPRAVVLAQREVVSRRTMLLSGGMSGALSAHQLKIEASGQFNGQLRTAQLDVHGRIQGHVQAEDMVVRSQGVVEGDLEYGNLSMERGSDLSGHIRRKDNLSPPAQGPMGDTIAVHLPVSIVKQLHKHLGDLQLSMANGDPLPPWISVDREHSQLVLSKDEFDRLTERGQTISLSLQAGEERLTFSLPPAEK